ncbi:Na+/H+ antiporter NhaC [Halobiforma lacisalsi AJ5]|uniref:Na+/H+ antiporter NhaC n=1 Tax=Natronobacterium lacisalsi AJ5 TaxID=358396 RepID=M0LP77_NATLA|nr:Na+/H+ antiporter NhaC [Halobiforma lacisalsi]APW96878.1 Na+/H+ antiporter NhaC [Halobiforma lacisalsi AJ5]EMA34908.1 Na+/H+ antiporter NhaC [Halobiforma lacisalsi AJ5]
MDLDFRPKTYDEIPEDKQPSLGEALVPIVGMLLFLSAGMIWLEMDPQIPLLWGIAFAGLFGRYYFGYTWSDLYDGISRSVVTGLQAILILFVIYMLIASWIDSGTIPTLMYYGLEFLSPEIFLPFTVVLSAIVAFAIGSSWTTAGTLGVAMIGIGSGLGIPEAMTAGAVLSGAYTGDKNSPLSDTTNLAAAVTNTELMDHIRAMRPGTLIAFGISLVLFIFLGLDASGSVPADRVAEIQGGLAGSYAISPLTFLPLVLTFALAFYGFPALPSLGAGIFAGVGVATTVQGVGFAAAWETVHYGTSPETGVELTNELLASGGLNGSMWVISIVVAALALGGILQETGVLAAIAHYIGRAVSSVAGLTAGTAAGTIAMNFLAAEQYMAIVVPGMTLQNLYDDYNLESRNLSRAVEAAGTTTSAFVPWGSGGVFMASALGVPVIEYAPYYFFGIISPLVLVLMGATGWRMFYKEGPEQEAPAEEVAAPSVD